MYPEVMLIPMREELTRAGIAEARSAEAVMPRRQSGTHAGRQFNCGCAAGKMRPGVRLALRNPVTPDRSVTVFAGRTGGHERARFLL